MKRNYQELTTHISQKTGVIVYLTAPYCNVCKSLKPKLKELVNSQFTAIEFIEIDIEAQPEISGQMQVFAIPTGIVYLDGKEFYRFGRNVSIQELTELIKRPYDLLTN